MPPLERNPEINPGYYGQDIYFKLCNANLCAHCHWDTLSRIEQPVALIWYVRTCFHPTTCYRLLNDLVYSNNELYKLSLAHCNTTLSYMWTSKLNRIHTTQRISTHLYVQELIRGPIISEISSPLSSCTRPCCCREKAALPTAHFYLHTRAYLRKT